ncbi:MAG: TetR/AcrR family transcriptional regulator [Myxococcales bacterium]|nr:TetR/AcrR family transcriptional regulator [Myxococcales bacterium]MCB9629585.1 TetR/AcrR family transcriptional regulator [Sandaracinaceae bacterium]
MPEIDDLRTPMQARAHKTRASLVAAAQAEYAEQGYSGTTAKSIAKRAGVSTGSFYQYFTDKDAVLRELAQQRATALFDGIIAEMGEELGAPAEHPSATPRRSQPISRASIERRLTGVVDAVVRHHREDPRFHAVVTERRLADPELDAATTAGERALVERTAALLAAWGHTGDCVATAFILFGMVEGSVHAHVLGHPIVSDTRFRDTLVAAVVRLALPSEP